MNYRKFSYFGLAVLFIGVFVSLLFFKNAFAELAVAPDTSGTDDLIGLDSAKWNLTVTTTADLARGDVVQIVFPNITGEDFDLTGVVTSSNNNLTLYTALQTTTTAGMLNTGFENFTGDYPDSFTTSSFLVGGPSGAVIVTATTTNVHGGTYALHIDNTGTYRTSFSQTISSLTEGDTYVFSLYGRDDVCAVADPLALMAFNTSSIDITNGGAGQAIFNYSTGEWDAYTGLAQVGASPTSYLVSGDFDASYTLVTTANASNQITVPSSTALSFVFYNQQSPCSIFVDDANVYKVSGTDTVGIGYGGTGNLTVYGFVSSTISSGSAYTIGLDAINNAAGAITDLTDMTWTIYGGTPTTSSVPAGSLSSTKFTVTSTASLTRTGSDVTGLSVTSSAYSEDATSVSYTFVFTAPTAIPLGGKIGLVFPTDFTLTSATVAAQDINSSSTPAQIASSALTTSTSYSRNEIVLTTSNATTTAGDELTITVGGISNPTSTGEQTDIYVYTTNATGGLLDNSYYTDGATTSLTFYTPGITVSESSGSTAVTEGSTTDTYTVVLDGKPASNVVVTPAVAGSQVTVSPSTLTFTTSNWATPQTITVTAVDDSTVESSTSDTVSHTSASSDTDYNGLTISSVSVTVTDDDVAASGGSSGVSAPSSSGTGDTTQTVNMNQASQVGEVGTGGTNVLMYIGSTANFTLSGAGHSVEVTNLDMINKKVTLLFNSNPVTAILAVGESKDLDLSGDGKNDTRVKFNSLTTNEVDITLTSLSSSSSTTTTNTTNTTATTSKPASASNKTTISKYTFKSYLGIGSSGEEVKQLQLLLKDLGYFTYPTATGYFGPITKTAVVKFQKAKNLTPYPGFVGPGTRAELNKLSTTKTEATTTQTTPTPAPVSSSNYTFKSYLYIGHTGEEVKQLQLKLKDLGYFTYPTATGYFGNITKEAVVKFQKAKNLTPYPGWVGPGTRSALNK